MLHNYGGNTGLYGKMETISSAPMLAYATPNATMIGVGLTPEGTLQNYPVYDMMLESAWRQEPLTNLSQVRYFDTVHRFSVLHLPLLLLKFVSIISL